MGSNGSDSSYVHDDDLFPAPFPENVPIVQLEKLSLKKLLERDPEQCARMYDICTKEGFFYVDLLDHPVGVKLYQDACKAVRVGKENLLKYTIEEKRTFKTPAKFGVFDRGYSCTEVTKYNEPRYSENFNVPQNELFANVPSGWKLPEYLAPYEEEFKQIMTSGNELANIILGVLEQELQLPKETLTSMHQLHDNSSDFLRMLRYPGVSERTVDHLGFHAHKDALSVAILFTWLGGLQLPKDGAKSLGLNTIAEDDWRWVKPERGCAIVNLGDAMEVFTNGLLKSGLHRVVRAAGEQAPFDKYSVLIGTRPRLDVEMKPFQSDVIPTTWSNALPKVMTSEEWGTFKVTQLRMDRLRREKESIFTTASGHDAVRVN